MYRLVFADRRPAVYAKRSRTSDLPVERALYQEILPRLPLSVPRYLGSHRDEEGAIWMFIEDVGDRPPSRGRRDDRVLAARWLGLLHGSSAGDAAASRLPDGGPARYLGHLRVGRAEIQRHFANVALTSEDRAVLTGMIARLDRLEGGWAEIERTCAQHPPTLVHGDFRRKNVRIRRLGDTTALYVLDWEMAGWGVPAADVASALAPGMTVSIDPDAYIEAVRDRWPDLDATALRGLSIVGRVFQAVAATKWATASLHFEWQRYLMKPVSCIELYRKDLVAALEAGREALGWS
jgi:aminoglycoside phosphotransferase (APT) family kinase protein